MEDWVDGVCDSYLKKKKLGEKLSLNTADERDWETDFYKRDFKRRDPTPTPAEK